jgi:voltage-gated potassium channel
MSGHANRSVHFGQPREGRGCGQESAALVRTPPVMTDETRLERRLDRLIERAVNPRKAAVVIAGVTTAITILAGWLMTLLDHEGFPTLGSGMWWAVQTVTTVGYGDHVPESAIGQFLAAGVMLLGIGFITVITASITGAFVARSRREQHLEKGPDTAESIQEIIRRLERIEESIAAQSAGSSS